MDEEIQADSAPLEEESAGEDTQNRSLDEAIESAMAGAGEEVGSVEREPEPEETEAEDGAEDGPETVEADSDSDTEGASEEPEPAGDLIAPDHWPEDQREVFGELPRKAQEIWMDRERQIHSWVSQKGQEYAAIDRALEPIQEQARLHGRTPDQVITQLVGWHGRLSEGKPEDFVALARLYGVDLAQQRPDAPDEEVFVDPHVEALRQTNEQLQGQIQQLTQQMTGFNQSREAEVSQQVNNAITVFSSARDESGNLAHPYFDRLRPVMSVLMKSGQAKTLEEAYEAAEWQDPTLRQQKIAALQTQQVTAAVQEVRETQTEAVQKAKGVRNVRSSPVKAPGANSKLGLDESISAALDQAGLPPD